MIKDKSTGQFVGRERTFNHKDLLLALLNHRSILSISGEGNPLFKDGESSKYVRIRVKGIKVPRSHIVYMLGAGLNKIPRGYLIHHKNENKRDDRFCNLKLEKAIPHGKWNMIPGNKIRILKKKEKFKPKDNHNQGASK
jgi:hypothetical protein